MQKFSEHGQYRFAKLWDAVRQVMVERAYGKRETGSNEAHPRMRRLQALADHFHADRVLDACIGSGTPALIDIEKTRLCENLYCSDGDPGMLRVLHERYFGDQSNVPELLRKRIFQVKWAELADFFGHDFADLALILGNSMMYAAAWDGSSPSLESQRNIYCESVKGVFDVLRSPGIFVFDIATYHPGRKGTLEFRDAVVDGKQIPIFIDFEFAGDVRTYTVRSDFESYSIAGLTYDLNEVVAHLKEAGFARIEMLPPELQLDTPFYTAYAAYK